MSSEIFAKQRETVLQQGKGV